MANPIYSHVATSPSKITLKTTKFKNKKSKIESIKFTIVFSVKFMKPAPFQENTYLFLTFLNRIVNLKKLNEGTSNHAKDPETLNEKRSLITWIDRD